jgi:hypothetical protein
MSGLTSHNKVRLTWPWVNPRCARCQEAAQRGDGALTNRQIRVGVQCTGQRGKDPVGVGIDPSEGLGCRRS